MKLIFKKTAVFFLILITLMGILFLAMSFYSLNFNPIFWSIKMRGFFGFAFIIISVLDLIFTIVEVKINA